MAMLSNSTFRTGLNGWRPVNNPNDVAADVIRDGTAYSGEAFLRAGTTVAGGSVAYDWNGRRQAAGWNDLDQGPTNITVFEQDPSFGVFAWVRSAPGQGTVSASLTVWELGLAANDNHPNRNFTVGNDWTLITNAIDVEQGSSLRIEFYIGIANVSLDIDSVIVV